MVNWFACIHPYQGFMEWWLSLVAMKQNMPYEDLGVFKLHVKVKIVFYVVILSWCGIESHYCVANNARLFS